MAELLVLNHDSWMEKLDAKQLAEYVKKYPKFMTKYNARQRKGDVVDIQDDGHWTGKGRGYNKDHYDVVIVKGKKAAELRDYRGSLTKEAATAEKAPEIVSKFRANIASYTNEQEVSLSSVTIKTVEAERVG